jgi:prolyl 4-hydroxylase
MNVKTIRMGYYRNKSRERIVEEKKEDDAAEQHLGNDNKRSSSDDECGMEQEENNLLLNSAAVTSGAATTTTAAAAFQMQQLQASLVAQQHFLEQVAAVAAVQQHLTPALNSLQLGNNSSTLSGAMTPYAVQQQQQHNAAVAAAAQVAASLTLGNKNNPPVVPTSNHLFFASPSLAGAHTVVPTTPLQHLHPQNNGNPQQALSAVGIHHPISLALAGSSGVTATGTNNTVITMNNNAVDVSTTPAVLQQQQQLLATPTTVTPSTTTALAAVAAQQQNHQQQHHHNHTPLLIPQRTIPHYIPPQPPSWGGQFPTLSVQDRPLVPPIYNGINPNYPGAQLLHAHPPIFCVHNFLSNAECDFLIHSASDAFGPAPVVGKGSGEVSPSRTSSTCYLAREDLPEYMRKITLLTGKPPEHCELPQVGRYYPSQQYLQHFDAFDLSNEDGIRFASNGGQRTITVLTYLNDVPRGGATSFPNLNIEVRPRKGMALVFFPATLDGLLDKMALHAALPAVDVKYVSQVWVRQSNYDGTPSKRLVEPMMGGLQERWEQQQQHVAAQQLLL